MAESARTTRLLLAILALVAGCGGASSSPSGPSPAAATSADGALFGRITQSDPLTAYTNFPDAEEFTVGRLNGSEAHRPVIRVRLNATARAALSSGRLSAGTQFPDGSIVVKELRPSATTEPTLYAVMVKDSGNPKAGNGWLWAEYGVTGSVTYSVDDGGRACTSCHRREQGPQNDLVRSFERQRP